MRFMRWIVLSALLGAAGTAPGIAGELQEQRYMEYRDHLQARLSAAQGKSRAESKAITEGCVSAPLSTAPQGPTWGRTLVEFGGEEVELTVWREPCSSNDAVLLMTFEPTVGDFFICSTRFKILQSNQQYDNITFRQEPGGFGSFCDSLLLTTTLAIDQSDFDPNWDDDAAFTLVYTGGRENQTLDVGPYKASDYGAGGGGDLEIDGTLSGSWYDPARNGEGFIFEVGENTSGRVISAYWFTYRDGRSYWLIGSKQLSPGQTEVTMTLFEFSGTGFGGEFDSSQISSREWGEITFRFDSCSTGTAEWNSTVGLGSGSFDLDRITLGIEGHLCG